MVGGWGPRVGAPWRPWPLPTPEPRRRPARQPALTVRWQRVQGQPPHARLRRQDGHCQQHDVWGRGGEREAHVGRRIQPHARRRRRRHRGRVSAQGGVDRHHGMAGGRQAGGQQGAQAAVAKHGDRQAGRRCGGRGWGGHQRGRGALSLMPRPSQRSAGHWSTREPIRRSEPRRKPLLALQARSPPHGLGAAITVRRGRPESLLGEERRQRSQVCGRNRKVQGGVRRRHSRAGGRSAGAGDRPSLSHGV